MNSFLKRTMVVIALFVTMLFAVKTAKADTGGYDVISVGDVATVRINAGINPAHLNAVFGASFKDATGVNFLSPEGYEKMMALNPDSMTPACRHPGDGAEFAKNPNATIDDKLAVWASCKKENMELWYKPSTIVRIPVKSTVVIAESFSSTLARRKALDACEDAACVASNTKSEKLKAAITGVPTATPAPVATATPSTTDTEALKSANATIKDLESKLAQANANPAPAAVLTPVAPYSRPLWPLFLLFFAAIVGLGIIVYAKIIKPLKRQIADQDEQIKHLQGVVRDLRVRLNTSETKKVEAETAKAQAEATLKQAQEALKQFVSTDSAKQRMIVDLQRQNVDLETRLGQQTANANEAQRQAAAYSAQVEAKNLECHQYAQRIAEQDSHLVTQGRELLHAAQMKIELQQVFTLQTHLAKVNEVLAPMQKSYRQTHFTLQECLQRKPMYEQVLQIFTKDPILVELMRDSAAKNDEDIAAQTESLKRLAAEMTPAMKERDDILRQLTGSADLDTLLFLEAMKLHDEAEEAAVIAREERAKAMAMTEEVSAMKAALTAQAQEFEGMVQVHRELEESLVVRERELNEERRVFEENRRAENESLANRKAALNHLLDDACELLCNERGMSVESILKMDGASGLLSEAARRTRAAEARAAELNTSLDELAANVEMLTNKLEGVTAEKDFAVNDAKDLRRDAQTITESLEKEISELQRRNEGLAEEKVALEKSVASLTTEIETYAAIAERRNEEANPTSQQRERLEETGSWEKARINGPSAPHGPVTQPMGIAAALKAKAEEVAAEQEAAGATGHADDEEEGQDPLLEIAGGLDLRSSQPHQDTIKGTPALMMRAALRSTKPPVIDGAGTTDQPTNGGPRRSSTLDGIQPPTEEFLAPRFLELTKVLVQINGHLDTTSSKPILDRPTCDALIHFLRRPCGLTRDLIDSSPQAAKILETDPDKQDTQIQVLVHGMTIARLGENTKKLGIVFPRKTLMPPSSPPSSLRSL